MSGSGGIEPEALRDVGRIPDVQVSVTAPPATSRAAILDAAREAVTVDRAATHGAAERSFALIAALWSARLGRQIAPHEVALMLIDLKTARAQGNPGHADNWIDIAGYAACGGEIATEGET